MNLAYDAMVFARHAHRDQVRKYTGCPYWVHLAEVAGIAVTAPGQVVELHVIAATAWLHDSIEDVGATFEQLAGTFGWLVAFGVQCLSDMETEGNRAARKEASRMRLAASPGWVQSIKCADLISNTSSIVQHDPKFAVTYLEEKRLLLDVLTKADPRLRSMARSQAEYRG